VGAAQGEGNIISGNNQHGVVIFGNDASGTAGSQPVPGKLLAFSSIMTVVE
jgi:hypothetical protein